MLVEFSDFQCPFCDRAARTVEEFLARHPDVTLVYRHLPVPELHPFAEEAALAAICATDQGEFAGMHRFLFQDTRWDAGSEVDWEAVARTVSLPDGGAFAECMTSPDARGRLDRDLQLAGRLLMRGTPTFIGPEGILEGTPLEETLARVAGVAR